MKGLSFEEITKVLDNSYGDLLSKVQKAIIVIANISHVAGINVEGLRSFCILHSQQHGIICKMMDINEHLVNRSWVLIALVRSKLPKSLIRKWDLESEENNDLNEIVDAKLPVNIDRMLKKRQLYK